jgi:hypothetical protein
MLEINVQYETKKNTIKRHLVRAGYSSSRQGNETLDLH